MSVTPGPHQMAAMHELIDHLAGMGPATGYEKYLQDWARRVKRMSVADEVEDALTEVEENISLVREGLKEWRGHRDDVYFAMQIEKNEQSLKDAVANIENGASTVSKKVNELVSRVRDDDNEWSNAPAIKQEVAPWSTDNNK
jgi:hypothetical protein